MKERRRTLFDSVRDATAGWADAFRTERNMRIHIGLAAIIFALAFGLEIDGVGWALLVLGTGGVIVVELLNTAVETVVDLVSPEHHPLAKRAKDVAAGAVLLQSVLATCLGYIVFSSRIPKPMALAPFILWNIVILFGFRAHKEVEGHDRHNVD